MIKRGSVVRLLAVVMLTLGVGTAVLSPAAQAAGRPEVSDRAADDVGVAACYEGRIPNSSRWDGNVSVHVYGSACKTRWARMVWDDNNNCCVPMWVKIDRQEYGSYGWLTSHTRSKKVLFGNFGNHDTTTVPWIQYTDQRFRACWGAGTSEPGTWNCGPWVN